MDTTPQPNGKAFGIDRNYQQIEALRRGDEFTELDTVKYGGAMILLPLLLLACLIGFCLIWLL